MMNKLIKLAAMAAIAFGYSNAYAFHSGGVAECNGCHTMHGQFEGAAMDDAPLGAPGPYLLRGETQSEACLTCHGHADDTAPSSYHILDNSTYGVNDGNAPANMTPGGDFAWVKKTFTWTPRNNTSETSKAERHGHNVVAPHYGILADTTLTKAPGGDFLAADLGCQSCHDPHGKFRRYADGSIGNGTIGSVAGNLTLPIANSGSYHSSLDPIAGSTAVGVYRILGGLNYLPKSLSASPSLAFANQVPAAVAHSTYNFNESGAQRRVAYGQGMSEWCANCHGTIHSDSYASGSNGLKHPAANTEALDTFIVANYNAYKKTGDLSGAADGTGTYNTLVPYEENIGLTHTVGDYATLKGLAAGTGNAFQGPTADAGAENVACISCHRVHASGFDSMLRWSMSYEFITADSAATPTYTAKAATGQGKTEAEAVAAYYGRPASAFSNYQRVLCNKCHLKD